MQNLAIVDEKFQALVEYVKHQFLVKMNMALDATWKEKKLKSMWEKKCKIGKPLLLFA
jgi:hypothetical protein